MLHTKSQGHRPSGSGEDCLRVFTIYVHGGPVVSEEMFENVDGQTDAGAIGILIAYLGAIGSGEIKTIRTLRLSLKS